MGEAEDRAAPQPARSPRGALAALLALLLGLLWGGLAWHLASQRALVLAQGLANVEGLTRVYAAQILGTLQAIDQTLLLLKQNHERFGLSPDPDAPLPGGMLLRGAAPRVQLYDADGMMTMSGEWIAYGGDTAFYRFHRDADDGRMRIGVPRAGEGPGRLEIDLSRRIDRPGDGFGGAVAIVLDPAGLVPVLTGAHAALPVAMAVVGLDHVIRAGVGSLPPGFGRIGEPLVAPQLLARVAEQPAAAAAGASPVDGVRRLVAYLRLEDYPLFVVATLPEAEVLAGFEANAGALLGAAALVSLLLVAAGLLLGRAMAQRAALAAAVAQSRAQLLEAQRLGKIGHFTTDEAAGTVTASAECFTMLGRPPVPAFRIEEGMGWIHPDDRDRYRAARDGAGGAIELRLLRPDGRPCWASIELRPRRGADGTRTGMFGIVQDITARKSAEQVLAEQTRRLRAILDHAPVAIYLKDRDGRYLMVNRQFERWMDVSGDMMIGRTDAELDPVISALSREGDRAVLEDGRVSRIERPVRVPRPGLEHIEVLKFPILDEAGAVVGLAGFSSNITERRQAEATIQEQARRLRAIMDNAPVAIFLKDRARRYLMVNVQFADWYGLPVERFAGRTDAELSAAAEALSRDSDHDVLERGRVARAERPVRRPRPGLLHVEIVKFPILGDDGDVVGLAGFLFNVSERRRVEEQLRQAAKMEAVGRLAGGLAHDVNNMIGAIGGFAQFLVEDLEPGCDQHQFAARILQVCDHARDLVGQVLAFARTDEVPREPIELGAAVAEQRPLVAAALPAALALTVASSPVPLPVLANRGQLHQILLNLCVNAADALAGRAGGITIETALVEPGDPDHAAFAETGAGPVARASGGRLDAATRHAVLRVRDTGGGMDQATLDRIFEPFFTTKAKGRGTGLGLAVIHGIVVGQGGAYRVRSRLGEGSEFSIYLPLREPASPVAGRAPPQPVTPGRSQGPAGTGSGNGREYT